ncbi:MAG TPA: heme biosynthesis HemY N-terminal domain-containing protein [Xanthobacteraceae bacterium]|nr:heme biosynthesis HemY N-terminal domain-containing protein [Xanthobacteraceae bacterium]
MIRVILFLALIAAIALGAAWLAERPGDVAVTWMGWQIETSVMVAVAAVAAAVVLIMMTWSLLRLLLRSPRLLAQLRRERRRRRGQRAVSRGLVAAASGDMRAARRFAGEAERFAGDEPLALLLTAQTAQLAGDRAAADAAFRAMAEQPETRLLGLRGLYVEAQRRGDAEAGRRHAEEAARRAPALPWAGQAVFEFRCTAGDWAGALAALDANLRSGLIERPAYRRQRAVLLTARALEAEEDDAANAKSLALEAAKLAPDLVPAVNLAAKLSAENGEWRRAAKLIETAWRTNPHPSLAETYAYLRPGDATRDRLRRIQELARLKAGDRESALALARAAIDAHEFATARAALAPLLERPTQRVAMLMAQLEEAEHGDAGRAREWMARALRAGGDPRWTADGMVSDRWLPVSPVSGRIDAFEWKVPVAEIAAPGTVESYAATLQPVAALPAHTADLHDSGAPPAVAQERAAASPAATNAAATPAAPQLAAPPAPPARSTGKAQPPMPRGVRSDAVIPLMHAPDDPGPDAQADPTAASSETERFPGGVR